MDVVEESLLPGRMELQLPQDFFQAAIMGEEVTTEEGDPLPDIFLCVFLEPLEVCGPINVTFS